MFLFSIEITTFQTKMHYLLNIRNWLDTAQSFQVSKIKQKITACFKVEKDNGLV